MIDAPSQSEVLRLFLEAPGFSLMTSLPVLEQEGSRVVALLSKKNFEQLKRLGATERLRVGLTYRLQSESERDDGPAENPFLANVEAMREVASGVEILFQMT